MDFWGKPFSSKLVNQQKFGISQENWNLTMQKIDLNDLATECCFSQEKVESTVNHQELGIYVSPNLTFNNDGQYSCSETNIGDRKQ
jgi:hypothetical protein